MAMPNKLEEQRKQLVDKIVADMEAGKAFFWEPGYTAHRMVNAMTGKPYRGGNAIALMAASAIAFASAWNSAFLETKSVSHPRQRMTALVPSILATTAPSVVSLSALLAATSLPFSRIISCARA